MAREVIEVSDSSESEGMNRQSPADQSPERSIADERSMPFAGKYAALRIGTTISSTSEYDTPMSDQGGDIPQVDPSNKYKIEVFVPPPRRPWEYRVYPDVSVILKVIRENERDKELNYLVKFKNGRLLTVSRLLLNNILCLEFYQTVLVITNLFPASFRPPSEIERRVRGFGNLL